MILDAASCPALREKKKEKSQYHRKRLTGRARSLHGIIALHLGKTSTYRQDLASDAFSKRGAYVRLHTQTAKSFTGPGLTMEEGSQGARSHVLENSGPEGKPRSRAEAREAMTDRLRKRGRKKGSAL